MSGAAPQPASASQANYGLPLRTIPIPDSPSASASSSAAPQAQAQPHPAKRGIRVRVNSLGAAVMLKHNALASTTDQPGPSTKPSGPSSTKTRLRSATWRSPDPIAPSPPSSSPAPSSSRVDASSESVSASPATTSQSVAAAASINPSSGFNRRKLFGRSNSIRSLLGGGGGANSSSSTASSSISNPATSSPSSDLGPRPSSASPGANPHPLGLLRRMGSKSFLNLNQSKQAAPFSDDSSSLVSVNSEPSKRFSDSLKGLGRRRGQSVSKERTYNRSSSSQSSSDFHPGRMAQSELLPNRDGSRRSIESVHSGLSITSPDSHQRLSEGDSVEARTKHDRSDLQSSVPRRLTGWLYNMVGSDNTASPVETAAPLSPVREADALELFAATSASPTRDASHSSCLRPAKVASSDSQDLAGLSSDSTPSRSKAGALLQSWASVGSGKAARFSQPSAADDLQSTPLSNSHATIALASSDANPADNISAAAGGTGAGDASGSASASGSGSCAGNAQAGSSATNNSTWVPGGVGLDRAFKFFLDTDPSAKDDEGIWLLGVWHGPRQSQKAVQVGGEDARSATRALATATPTAGSDAADEDPPSARRAASPPSSTPASSPRRRPVELSYASFAPASSAQHPDSAGTKESSHVGSSISTGATASTADSLRTRSSATSFNVASSGSASAASEAQSAFQPDFASRIWCTYRNHFAPIARDGTISDQAAAAAEALAAAQSQASEQSATPAQTGVPSSPEAPRPNSPPATNNRGWLGRKTAESNVAQEASAQATSPLGLGAALGAGYANASASLGEKMGITNLWSRATAAAQAAGFSRAGLTTDSGWGCMLRTGQSLLANALINVHLDRSWQREAPPKRQIEFFEELANLCLDAAAENQWLSTWRERRSRHATYIKILSWFLDDPSPACPFGVHRMAREGKRLGKEVGEWFGPSTAAGAIKQLVSDFPEAGIAVELAHDGVFYLDEVRAAASASSQSGKTRGSGTLTASRRTEAATWRRPVLILIGIRLGLDSVNPIYYESVKATFSFPQSVGIAGGRPSSSYYFMGHQGNSLFYLDPHNVRPAVPLRYPPSTFPAAAPRRLDVSHRYALDDRDDEDEWWSHAYTEAQTSTFHCEKVRRMPIKSLDPSMLLGFLVKDEEALVDLCARIKALPKTIFSFAESAPKWVDDDDFDPSMESFSEPSADEGGSDEDIDKGAEGEGAHGLRVSSQGSNPVAGGARAGLAFPTKRDASSGAALYRESQQRTAAWLGHGRPDTSAAKSNGADGAGAGGIAFPSLDLLTPHNDGLAVQRPIRPDVRQVSTSSATTTRAAVRKVGTGASTDAIEGRDLTASPAPGASLSSQTGRASPSRSPARLGADESFSTVHLSDSEVGSAWEEVSDGGTIAPSASATSGLHRTGSPALLGARPGTAEPAQAPLMVAPMRDGLAQDGDLMSPVSVVSESELVGISLDTPVDEAPEKAYFGDAGMRMEAGEKADSRGALPASPVAGPASHAGLTSAHTPLSLPRRRVQSRPSPVDVVPSDGVGVPPVPALPADVKDQRAQGVRAGKLRRPDRDDSEDDF